MQKANYNYFIEGERIYLREVRLEDVNYDYYHWLNDEEVNRYTESRFVPQSVEQICAFVTQMAADSSAVFLAIIHKETGRHIGNIKLGGINWKHRYGDIGLIIGAKEVWGQGYGSEAILLVSEFARKKLNLRKVWCGCYAPNIGSIKAFENAGFVPEGMLKAHYFCDGEYVDGVLLGKILD